MKGFLSFTLAASWWRLCLTQQGRWEQCGGQNWSGGTTCIAGWSCQFQNPYYSQCLQTASGQDPNQSNGAQAVVNNTQPTNGTNDVVQTNTNANTNTNTNTSTDTDTDTDTDDDSTNNNSYNNNNNYNANNNDNETSSTTAVNDNSNSNGNSGSNTTTAPLAGSSGTNDAIDNEDNLSLTNNTNLSQATFTYYQLDAVGGGACQCTGADWQAPLDGTYLTAAGNSFIFQDKGGCGGGCGKCFRLTHLCINTDGTPLGSPQDPCPPTDGNPLFAQSAIVMVTNLCPADDANSICHSPNQFGVQAHFDIAAPQEVFDRKIGQNRWDHARVTYEPVPCNTNAPPPGAHIEGSLKDHYSSSCKCPSNDIGGGGTSVA